MEIDDEKKDFGDLINLEEAANTLIQIGLNELEKSRQEQPERLVQPQNPQRGKGKAQKRAKKKQQQNAQPNRQKKNKQPRRMFDHVIFAKLKGITQALKAKTDEVNELKNKIKTMEEFMAMNSNRPKFEHPQYIHPLNFIENLMTYLKNCPFVINPVETAVDCLYGDAKSWATIAKDRWKNFEDFKTDFLKQYWGEAEQNMLRREIATGVWDKNQIGTMCRHLMCLVAQTKWLPYQIPDEQLLFQIMTHYPKYIQISWVASKGSTIVEAVEFLKKMDGIESQFEVKRDMNQSQKSKNKNKNHQNQSPMDLWSKYTIDFVPGGTQTSQGGSANALQQNK